MMIEESTKTRCRLVAIRTKGLDKGSESNDLFVAVGCTKQNSPNIDFELAIARGESLKSGPFFWNVSLVVFFLLGREKRWAGCNNLYPRKQGSSNKDAGDLRARLR